MPDWAAGPLGLALIVGLLVAYARQRRARTAPSPRAPNLVLLPDREPQAESSSRSPNWGAPILFVALLAGAATHRGSFWGYLWQAIYGAIVLLGAYSAFSPKAFAAEVARRPDATRTQHYLMLGAPYVLFPMVGWIVTIPLGWNPGMFIPALPWAALAVLGATMLLRGENHVV